MEYLQNLLDAAWALRWVITFCVVAGLAALLFGALNDRDDARAEARGLYLENAELRAALRAGGRQIPARRKRPVAAGRVIRR